MVVPCRVGTSGVTVVPLRGFCSSVTMSLFCGRDLCLSLCVYFLLSFLVATPSCKILSEFSYGVSVNVIIFPSVVVNWGTAG